MTCIYRKYLSILQEHILKKVPNSEKFNKFSRIQENFHQLEQLEVAMNPHSLEQSANINPGSSESFEIVSIKGI